MLLDLAQPAALLLSILSLYATFHAAFLATATPPADRAEHALLRLAFAAAISLLAGLLFRERALDTEAHFDADFTAHFGHGFTARPTATPLRSTLPVRLFCWSTAAMAILFALSWYLETYVVPDQTEHRVPHLRDGFIVAKVGLTTSTYASPDRSSPHRSAS